jgi:hypothetical protein
MNSHRFTQIIDAYGSRAERWPQDEREAMQQHISIHAAAQQYLHSQISLDALLDADLGVDLGVDLGANLAADLTADFGADARQPALQRRRLEARIMANLPPALPTRQDDSLADRLLAWLLPGRNRGDFWRPTLVACLPLLVGLAIGSNVSLETQDDSYTWDEEVYLLGLSADNGSADDLWMAP